VGVLFRSVQRVKEEHERLLWTVDEVAKQLHVSTKTVSRIIRKGELPFIKIEEISGYKKQMFLIIWNTKKVIIWSAWSQCCFQKEKTHATL